jgi:hypothetical protein
VSGAASLSRGTIYQKYETLSDANDDNIILIVVELPVDRNGREESKLSAGRKSFIKIALL